jgi:hypothetical protein
VRRPRLFLRVYSAEARPRLAQTSDVRDDGAVYLGPFRSAAAAAQARRLAEQVFDLRPPPPLPRRKRRGKPVPSAQLPLSNGLSGNVAIDAAGVGAPFPRPASPFPRGEGPPGAHDPLADYRQRLQDALLAGERQQAVQRLQGRMRDAARAGDHSAVTRLRELLRQVLGFTLREAALSMSPHTDTFLAFDGRDAYLIHAARLLARVPAASLEAARAAVAPYLAGRSADPSGGMAAPLEMDDECHLVLRWLSTRGPGWKIVRL